MLSDKLTAKGDFVKKREHLRRVTEAFIMDGCKGRTASFAAEFSANLYHLLDLNAELAQAPVLYTLQSAAEVGFSHADLTTLQSFTPPDATEEGTS